MEDRIELTLDRVMATFFKTETVKKEEQEAGKAIEEEYQLLLEEDILKRHGHL